MKEKINFKRLGIAIGIVFLTALVVGGTTWYVMNEQNEQDKEALQTQIDVLTAESNDTENTDAFGYNPENDPIKDWQTYTNKQYNFSFKYPQELVATECAGKIGIEETPLVTMLSKNKLTCNSLAGDIQVELIKGGGVPEPDESTITNKIETTIDGEDATRYYYKSEGPKYTSQVTGVMHNGYAINFTLIENSDSSYNEELDAIFTNILRTIELN